jgi:hypothetical protein
MDSHMMLMLPVYTTLGAARIYGETTEKTQVPPGTRSMEFTPVCTN